MNEDVRTPVQHEFPHETAATIHDPEQEMTILARWLHRGVARGPKFWLLLGGVVLVGVVVATLASALKGGRTSVAKAWGDLDAAQTPGQRADIAEAFPETEVGRIARLQAGADFFYQATTRDLPNSKDSALPQLKKALDLFQQVVKEAPKDASEALAAAFFAARTLEARNELPEAIEQYKAVAAGWPGTPEATQSEALAAKLKTPEVVAFYNDLYTYKAPTATLPPPIPTLGGPSPIGGLSTPPSMKDILGPGPIDLPPPPMVTMPAAPASPTLTLPDLPANPIPASTPSTAETKPLPLPTPTPVPRQATPKGELPADPFTPEAKPKP